MGVCTEKTEPRIFTGLHGFDPRTKHQEQSTKNLLGCLVRVPFVFHPSLKKGIGKTSHGFSPISTDSIQQLRVSLTQRQLQSPLFHTQVAATDSACAGNSLASRMGNRTKSGMERNHISCRRTNWRVCAFTWSIIMASPILPFMNSNGSL